MIEIKTKKNNFINKAFQNFCHAQTFIEALGSVKYLAFILGLMPYNFKIEPGNSKAVPNVPAMTISICGFVCYIYCVFTVVSNGDISLTDDNYSILQRICVSCCIYLGFFSIILIFITVHLSRHSEAETFELFSGMDESLKELNESKDYSKLKRNLFVKLVILLICQSTFILASLFLISGTQIASSIELGFALYTPSLVSSMVLIMFNSFAKVLLQNMKALNNQLSSMLKRNACLKKNENVEIKNLHSCPLNDNNHALEDDDVVKKLQIYLKVYDKICDCVDILNISYGIKNLTVLALAFISSVLYFFNVLTTAVVLFGKVPSLEEYFFLIFSMSQIFLYKSMIFGTIYMCTKCQNEGRYTSVLVNKLGIAEVDENIKKKLLQFSMSVLNRRPVFTAYGLFNIDNSLLFTMIGATSTYLVILIQFSMTFLGKPENLSSTNMTPSA